MDLTSIDFASLWAPLAVAAALLLAGGVMVWKRRRARAVPSTVAGRAAERRAQRGADTEPEIASETDAPAAVPHRRAGLEVDDLSGGVVDIDDLLADIARVERRRLGANSTLPPDTSAMFGSTTVSGMIATVGGTEADTGPPDAGYEPTPGEDPATRRWKLAELLEAATNTIPLRELVLAWCEARGYRVSPASPEVAPVEAVLRHKKDLSRVYAFIVEDDYVDRDRLAELRQRTEAIGLMRMMVVAVDGYQLSLAQGKDVRLIDRASMEHQLHRLDLRIAAKIVSVARRRMRHGEARRKASMPQAAAAHATSR